MHHMQAPETSPGRQHRDVEADEQQALIHAEQGRREAALRVVGFGGLMICLSVTLINFNKYLMGSEVFPFPLHLVLFQTMSGSLFAGLLYQAAPSLFPTLAGAQSTLRPSFATIMGKAVPVAVCFAGNLIFSNMAYFHCSVAFLQFMKEGNVMLVYAMSLAVGLEVYRSQGLLVLIFIMLATACCVHGEVNFSPVGFLIQLTSQMFEVCRIILQSILLSSAGLKLDALTYVLTVMPACFVTLLMVLGVISALDAFGIPIGSDFSSPNQADLMRAWPLLLANAALAFALNVSVALFIKVSSAVALVLAGLLKDCCAVVLSLIAFQESISKMQTIGFSCQILGVCVWSLMQQFPAHFEAHGILGGTWAALNASNAKPTKPQ
jgi:hypothetical protein